MLNITHYQRNANQNHNEVPLHASQDGCYPKVYKQQMLERVWRKGNPLTLLVGIADIFICESLQSQTFLKFS